MENLVRQHERAWREQGMMSEQIRAFRHQFLESIQETLLTQAAAAYVDGSWLTGAKRNIHDGYNDMLDPKHEWLNLSAASWDRIWEEVALNAPLIIASGGTASLARAALSQGARAVAERIVIRQAIRAGAKLTVQELAERASTGAAGKVAGLLAEGAVFEVVHSALAGDLPHDLPAWASRILWSSAALGVFHRAGKVSERLLKSPYLVRSVGKIRNTPVRTVAETLIVRGNVETAAMLLIAAAQNGAAGNLDEFFANIGNELLHAYVSIGALKIGHGVVQTARGTAEKTAAAPVQREKGGVWEEAQEATQIERPSGGQAEGGQRAEGKDRGAEQVPGTTREIRDRLVREGYVITELEDGTWRVARGDDVFILVAEDAAASDRSDLHPLTPDQLKMIERPGTPVEGKWLFDKPDPGYTYEWRGKQYHLRIERLGEDSAFSLPESRDLELRTHLLNAMMEQRLIAQKLGLPLRELFRSLRISYSDRPHGLMENGDSVIYMKELDQHVVTLRKAGCSDAEIASELAGHLLHENAHDNGRLASSMVEGEYNDTCEVYSITAQLAYYCSIGYEGASSYDQTRYRRGLADIQQGGSGKWRDHAYGTAIAHELIRKRLAEHFPEYARVTNISDPIEQSREIRRNISPEQEEKLRSALRQAIADSNDYGAVKQMEQTIRERTSPHTYARSRNISALKSYLMAHEVDAPARIAIAEALLNRTLNEPERVALLEAHALPGEIDALTPTELRAKTEKLAEAFPDAAERRLLIEAGLAGWPRFLQGILGRREEPALPRAVMEMTEAERKRWEAVVAALEATVEERRTFYCAPEELRARRAEWIADGYEVKEGRAPLFDRGQITVDLRKRYTFGPRDADWTVSLARSGVDVARLLLDFQSLGIVCTADDLRSAAGQIASAPEIGAYLGRLRAMQAEVTFAGGANDLEKMRLVAEQARTHAARTDAEFQAADALCLRLGIPYDISRADDISRFLKTPDAERALNLIESADGYATFHFIMLLDAEGMLANAVRMMPFSEQLRRIPREWRFFHEQWGAFLRNDGLVAFAGEVLGRLHLPLGREDIPSLTELGDHRAAVAALLDLDRNFSVFQNDRQWREGPAVSRMLDLLRTPDVEKMLADPAFAPWLQKVAEALRYRPSLYHLQEDIPAVWSQVESRQRIVSPEFTALLKLTDVLAGPVISLSSIIEYEEAMRAAAAEHPALPEILEKLRSATGRSVPFYLVFCMNDLNSGRMSPLEDDGVLNDALQTLCASEHARSLFFEEKTQENIRRLSDAAGYRFGIGDLERLHAWNVESPEDRTAFDVAARLHAHGTTFPSFFEHAGLFRSVAKHELTETLIGLDPKARMFVLANLEDVISVPKHQRLAYVEILRQMDHSPSGELQRVKHELARQLAASENPSERFSAIREVFEQNNIPLVGKLFRVFEILHTPSQLAHRLDALTSPYLRQSQDRRRYVTFFSDLLRVHVESNEASLRSFLTVIVEMEEALRLLENPSASWSTEQQRKLTYGIRKFEALQRNSRLDVPETQADEGRLLTREQIVARYRDLRAAARAREGQSLADRYAEMFARPLGYASVGDVLRAMDASREAAHARGLATARDIVEGDLHFAGGDLVKGVKHEFMLSTLERGFTSPEFLGQASEQDQTHYDTDCFRITADDAAKGLEGVLGTGVQEWGNYYVIFKDRGQFQRTTLDQNDIPPSQKYELFVTGHIDPQRHAGIRTGIGSTQVDCIVTADRFGTQDESGVIRAKKLSELKIGIAQNGWYVPIVDMRGALIFSPQEYTQLRRNFTGLDRFQGEDIPLIDRPPDIAERVVERHREAVAEQQRAMERTGDTPQASAAIQRVIAQVLAEEGVALKDAHDTSLGGARLYDIGSTGRGTNLPGDFDFDFTLKLNDAGLNAPFERVNAIRQSIVQRLGGDASGSHPIQHDGGWQIRIKGAELPGGRTADIDIAIMPSSEVTYVPTHQAVEERLQWIRENRGDEAYQDAVANILLAKKTLKNGNAYKKEEHGGWGGVGVENWILLNGGNFLEACRTFWNAAHDPTGAQVSLEEFQKRYPVVNPGLNFRDLKHDIYTRYLTQEGYEAMLRVIGSQMKL